MNDLFTVALIGLAFGIGQRFGHKAADSLEDATANIIDSASNTVEDAVMATRAKAKDWAAKHKSNRSTSEPSEIPEASAKTS